LTLTRNLEGAAQLASLLHVLPLGHFHLAVLFDRLGDVADLLLVSVLRLFLSYLGNVCDGNELPEAQ